MDKSNLRASHIKLRKSLSAEDRQKSSQRISKLFIRTFNTTNKLILSYNSIDALGEVETSYIHNRLDHQNLTIVPSNGFGTISSRPYDIIVVPIVAFDATRNRLGMGGGWYDRILLQYPNALKIGLAYGINQAATLPTDTHDIAMDFIVTEAKIF